MTDQNFIKDSTKKLPSPPYHVKMPIDPLLNVFCWEYSTMDIVNAPSNNNITIFVQI